MGVGLWSVGWFRHWRRFRDRVRDGGGRGESDEVGVQLRLVLRFDRSFQEYREVQGGRWHVACWAGIPNADGFAGIYCLHFGYYCIGARVVIQRTEVDCCSQRVELRLFDKQLVDSVHPLCRFHGDHFRWCGLNCCCCYGGGNGGVRRLPVLVSLDETEYLLGNGNRKACG